MKKLDFRVKREAYKSARRSGGDLANFLRKQMEDFEKDNEEEFLLNSESIVDIGNKNERELYFYNLGKRLEKTWYDQITHAENRLENLERRKNELEKVNYL